MQACGTVEKTGILDQLVELTGWHRDHARTQLRNQTKPNRPTLLSGDTGDPALAIEVNR